MFSIPFVYTPADAVSVQPVVSDGVSLGRIKSVASKGCIKLNNATISLLSNSPPSPDTSDSPFNWSNAWLYSGSAISSSPPTIEAQVHITPASNNSGSNLYMADRAVTVTSVVKNTEPSNQVGKVKKPRVAKVRLLLPDSIFISLNSTKGNPYSKDKGDRKKTTAEV
jgi:hypothetical protein